MLLENFGLLFFNILFGIVNGMISLFISPIIGAINSLLTIFLQDYEYNILDMLSSINQLINNVIAPGLVWVVNLFPPITFNVCMFFLGLWLLLWSYEFTAGVIIRCLVFLKRVIPFI